MNSKILVIAGMHRSGTSLITHWLHRCGLFVGQRLLAGNFGNIEGHFEDIDFLEAHQSFLRERRLPDTGFTDRSFDKLRDSEKERLKKMIETKNSEHHEWGWKEPRTCLFLDTYHELIPSAFYLFVVRDYNATVNSLVKREYKLHMKRFETKKGLSRIKWKLYKKKSEEQLFEKYSEQFLRTWIHYYERILDQVNRLEPGKYLFVHYSQLLESDKEIFDTIKNTWQFSLDYLPFNDVFKKELLSDVRNTEYYIRDKSLVKKAITLQQLVNQLLVHRSYEIPVMD